MVDFAFRMTAPEKKQIKGALEVRAKLPTRMGTSDKHVPEGSIGYVTSASPTHPGKRVVFWPSIEREHKGDWRTAVHDASDLEPTGKRG